MDQLQVYVEVGHEMDALEDLVVEHGVDGYSYYLLAAAKVLEEYALNLGQEENLDVLMRMIDCYLDMTEPDGDDEIH